MKKIRWGIVGLGNIAHSFTQDLVNIEGAELVAVASRSIENAKSFAHKFCIEKFYGSYSELFADKEIDIIYISTTNDLHAPLTIEALSKGKHVLCEKPIALNLRQAKEMVKASKESQKFFMEALWTRFNPSVIEVLDHVKRNTIGDVRYINADFAFLAENPKIRLTEKGMGGGSLLDIGIYPLFLSYLIFGKPEKILASSIFYESGVDEQTSMILQYKNAQSILHSGFATTSNMVATINGSKGRININSLWHEAQSFTVVKNNHTIDYHFPTMGKGFTYEILECHNSIRTGKIESELWSHQNSLDLIEIIDEIKLQIGLKF
ncbi:Gfo/Idh/MocA family protein [Namhaeicola litoreus]|uniref:Gfo/Idh/MocA family protein n=1 Tax=Namhaeicola litoreus TaxID=1052145 RepID=A0ABW3Y3T2_9FLAO